MIRSLDALDGREELEGAHRVVQPGGVVEVLGMTALRVTIYHCVANVRLFEVLQLPFVYAL